MTNPEFEFTDRLDPANLASANRLFLRKSWTSRRTMMVLIVGWLLFSGFTIIGDGDGIDSLTVVAGVLSGLVWAVGILAILVPFSMFVSGRGIRTQAADLARLAPETRYSLCPEKLRAENAVASNRFAWGQFKRWIENDRVFVLMTTNVGMIVIPKQVAGSEAVDFMRSRLIAAGVPSR